MRAMLGTALLAGVLAAGCGAPDPSPAAAPPASPPAQTAPAPPPPQPSTPPAAPAAQPPVASTAAPLPKLPDPMRLPPIPDLGFAPPRPIEEVRAVYQFAAMHPEVMRYVPCFCGCERSGHQDNEDCFVRARAADGSVTWEPHGLG
jgi:hypothetical protein